MEKELKIVEIAGYFHTAHLLVGFILSSNPFSLLTILFQTISENVGFIIPSFS